MPGIVAAFAVGLSLLLGTGTDARADADATVFEAIPAADFRSLLRLQMAVTPGRFAGYATAIRLMGFAIPGRSAACREAFMALGDPGARASWLARARWHAPRSLRGRRYRGRASAPRRPSAAGLDLPL